MPDARPDGGQAEIPIRRLDWRFLLPEPGPGPGSEPEPGPGPEPRPGQEREPEPGPASASGHGTGAEPRRRSFRDLLVVGGEAGIGSRAVEVGVAHELRSVDEPDPAELVVILDGARPSASEVARRLRPTGVTYWEVDRARPGAWALTPSRFCGVLRKAGLEPLAVHASVPNFRACKLLLPIDIPQPLRWYLASLFPQDTVARRALAGALRMGFRGNGRWAAPLIPTYSVTAVGPGFRGQPLPGILSDPAVPPRLRIPGTRVAVLTDAGNRVALLPFAPGADAPGAVLKVPKVTGVNDRTENEHHRLREIRGLVPPALAGRMPEPLALLHRDGIAVSVESFLPGMSLLASSGMRGRSWGARRDDLEQAARWLAEFHRTTEIRREPWGPAEAAAWVDGPTRLYRQAFGATDLEERLLGAWQARARELEGQPFSVVWHHRDYNVWNIFRSGGGVSVIDWEGVRPGPPLCDLLHFVTHWHETVARVQGEDARLRAFRDLFFGAGKGRGGMRMRRAIQDALAGYMARLELSPRFLPLLLVHTWVELALRRRQQQEDMGEAAAARLGNRNFPYIEILAEHTDALFGETPSGSGVVGRVGR